MAIALLSKTEKDRQTSAAQFERLQRKLVPLWRSIRSLNDDEQTIVVVPSLSVDIELTPAEVQAYEERFLFILFLLRQPRARMVYASSLPIRSEIIEYYLDLLPGVLSTNARKRLFLVTPEDGSSSPLSRKLLDRPRLLRQMRSLLADPNRAHLVPFNTTELERDLSLALGIPMYAADPTFLPMGTKTGGREIFAEEGVPHPLGRGDLYTEDDAVEALAEIRDRKPSTSGAMVKLNEGVSGQGNAVVRLEGLCPPGNPEERDQLRERLRAMRFETSGAAYDRYMAKFAQAGGVVEERVQGDEVRSPSVQLRVTPLGELEVLSTHDQLLGGPSGQSFLGCRFPADPAYAGSITREAEKVGRRLAREGVLGRFALDFVVARTAGGEWEPYAIELNLRKGGTTHPFLTLQFLTGGTYDPGSAVFTTPAGHRKYFVASDHVESPRYHAFTPEDLLDIVVDHRLHFDHARQAGVVLHMMSAVATCGRCGLTAVGDSPQESDAIYRRAIDVLDAEAEASLRDT